MSRGLVRTVIVEDDHGERHVLRPGRPVPSWAVGLIRNPAAWGEVADAGLPAASAARTETGAVEAPPSPPDAAPAPVRGPVPERAPAVPAAEPERVEPAPDPPPHLDPPPKGGRGSSAAAWREYAAANEVAVPSDMDRDDVIEVLEKHNVRTE